uniref:Uncharacterized protein n=1 Tax=uncultured bacterium scaffold00090 TaxID=1132476 RepID=I6ZM96_9BACT|nr:hypothetical protein [uncultured bacterium scaffold00090]
MEAVMKEIEIKSLSINPYICRTLYHAPLLEDGFVDKGLIDFNYPNRDFHEMYIGEIIKVAILTRTRRENCFACRKTGSLFVCCISGIRRRILSRTRI